jgi:hypothetical protein
MNSPFLDRFLKQQGTSILGLALDGNRLEGMVLSRTNGSLEIKNAFSADLALDPLASDAELVGREIRKVLDAAGVRQRRCSVCVPLSWVLTHTAKLPQLPEADQAAFLQIEAERHFPYSPTDLVIAISRFRSPAGEEGALLAAVPRDHVLRLDAALGAAKLKPVSFSLGLTALPAAQLPSDETRLVLLPGETTVGLLITSPGGLIALRSVEGAFDVQDTQKKLQVEPITREVRITLGQLPVDLQDQVRRLSVIGNSPAAQQLVQQLGPRLETLGITVEHVTQYAPADCPWKLPSGALVSSALSLGIRQLAGHPLAFQFLPPKVSAWQQVTQRYSSRKLVYSGAALGAVAGMIVLAFAVQQWQLVHWRAKWSALAPRVAELESLQLQIKRFRPWYDESFRTLSILKRLTEAFPDDGSVSVKTVDIRDSSLVTCTGSARNNQALLRTLDKLRNVQEINNSLQVEQIRGRSPMQFTFNFHWTDRSNQ